MSMKRFRGGSDIACVRACVRECVRLRERGRVKHASQAYRRGDFRCRTCVGTPMAPSGTADSPGAEAARHPPTQKWRSCNPMPLSARATGNMLERMQQCDVLSSSTRGGPASKGGLWGLCGAD